MFKWCVLVKGKDEPHFRVWGWSPDHLSARQCAENYIKGAIPGAEAVVLEGRDRLKGTITVHMSLAGE